MKVLCIDGSGSALDWVFRVKKAGHEVRWYMKPGTANGSLKIGDGFGLDKVKDWKASMGWADLIVLTDNADLIDELEPYWKKGFPIFGPNKAATKLEKDRGVGLKVLEDCGIPVVPYQIFKSLPDAEKFILDNPKKVFVVKPSGDTGVDRAMSHVSKTADDLLETLYSWKKKGCLPKEFLLQEKIKGIEVGVGGWFGPGGWSQWREENFEFKKLMPGDVGPNCGEQGTVMRYTKESKLAKMLLEPLTDYLHSIEYIGNIDINCMVGEDGTPWPLEFTCRLGWPAFCIQQRIHKGDPVEWMLDMIEGRNTLDARETCAVGIVYSQPDYPYHLKPVEDMVGTPLYGLEKVWDDVHPQEIMVGEYLKIEGKKVTKRTGYVSAGGYLFVASALAPTVEKAADKALETIKAVDFPNDPMYRIDIGKRLEEQLSLLQKYGFVKGLKYA